ncbi:hypothetical protein ACIOC2_16355 [Streptomyces sp. NPDC088337]|uniref:hypothetical protein n=1 Tax=unclassified Streptomyces TaxID=2593676 RepID=UPI0038234320
MFLLDQVCHPARFPLTQHVPAADHVEVNGVCDKGPAAARTWCGGAHRVSEWFGEATVRALELLRDLDDFFGWDIKLAIDAALVAPQATFPPPRD